MINKYNGMKEQEVKEHLKGKGTPKSKIVNLEDILTRKELFHKETVESVYNVLESMTVKRDSDKYDAIFDEHLNYILDNYNTNTREDIVSLLNAGYNYLRKAKALPVYKKSFTTRGFMGSCVNSRTDYFGTHEYFKNMEAAINIFEKAEKLWESNVDLKKQQFGPRYIYDLMRDISSIKRDTHDSMNKVETYVGKPRRISECSNYVLTT